MQENIVHFGIDYFSLTVNSQAWSMGNKQQLYLPFILLSDCKKVWFWSCERCFVFTWGGVPSNPAVDKGIHSYYSTTKWQ